MRNSIVPKPWCGISSFPLIPSCPHSVSSSRHVERKRNTEVNSSASFTVVTHAWCGTKTFPEVVDVFAAYSEKRRQRRDLTFATTAEATDERCLGLSPFLDVGDTHRLRCDVHTRSRRRAWLCTVFVSSAHIPSRASRIRNHESNT